MRIDKCKIRKHKFCFVILCVIFLAGLGCMARIADLFVKTDEISTEVVKTYKAQNSKHGAWKWRMNIRWVDLNGNVRTEGNLANNDCLEVGDNYIISVDAKTHSRRILPRSGNIFVFIMGICFCTGSIVLTFIFYKKETSSCKIRNSTITKKDENDSF